MTARGGDPGRLEPGRAGADHHDLARRPVRRRNHVRHRGFAPGRGIVDAQCLAALVDAIDAVADPDARADALFLAAQDLGDDVRIGHVRARHADHVDQALADRMVRGRDVIDPRGVEGRHAERGPDLPGEREVRRRRRAHAGDDV